MKYVNIVLPDSTYKIITRSAEKKGVDTAQYCSALLSEFADAETCPPHRSDSNVASSPHKPITEVDLMREILAYLRQKGGAAPKVSVEEAVFEGLKSAFVTSYYSELVGGGVPRWKKNIQFARNTARNMGLIKPPEESGRGNWELTEKGQKWDFE